MEEPLFLDTALVTETFDQKTQISQQNSPSPALDLDRSIASAEESVMDQSVRKRNHRCSQHSSSPQRKRHNAGPTDTETEPQDTD